MRGSSAIWRALARARRSNLAASGAAPPILGSAALTRRRALAALAAGAAAPLVGSEAPARAPQRSRVAVVGGGLAGLTALRALRRAGVDAHLYEGRNRLGGRVYTLRDGPSPADHGGQFINGDHEDILALARHYRVPLIDRAKLPGRTVLIDRQRVIHEAELAKDLQAIAARIAADSELLDKDYARHAPALDALSVAAYLDRHADALPQPYLRRLLAATIRTEFGQEPGEASALELIFNLPVADGRHVELIGTSDERYVLAGGSGMVTDALAREHAAFISTGRILSAIEPAGAGVRLRFTDGQNVEAERAIVTVPAPLLRTIEFGSLLPPLWRHYAAEAELGRNEKLNALYQGRPWRQGIDLAGDVWPLDGPFSEAWDATTVEGDVGVFTWFMGGDQCEPAREPDTAALRRQFETAVAPIMPAIGDSATGWQRRTNWVRDPFSRGSYSCFRPGQLTRFARLLWIEEDGKATQAAAAGPLVFAGEHLSDAWPGYMNGAAQTGRLAAEAVLRSLGRRQAAPAIAD